MHPVTPVMIGDSRDVDPFGLDIFSLYRIVDSKPVLYRNNGQHGIGACPSRNNTLL